MSENKRSSNEFRFERYNSRIFKAERPILLKGYSAGVRFRPVQSYFSDLYLFINFYKLNTQNLVTFRIIQYSVEIKLQKWYSHASTVGISIYRARVFFKFLVRQKLTFNNINVFFFIAA